MTHDPEEGFGVIGFGCIVVIATAIVALSFWLRGAA